MKILHIINSLEIGGAQRLLSDMLPLIAKNHDVKLLVNKYVENDYTRKIKEAGVTISATGCRGLYSPMNLLRIAKMAKGYDVVHAHLFPTLYWAALASLFTSMRLVYTEHSTSNRRRRKWYFRSVEQFIFGRYQCIISISPQVQDSLVNWIKARNGDARFTVINNGVNLSLFKNQKKNKMYPHTLIMVSRFVAAKDQATVIRAMRLMKDDVHVIFVGDGEKLEPCKVLAQEKGVYERTHFVGSQLEVMSWLARADIGIQSSHWEGFGLTAVEMMAAGLPVVATDVDGLKQVVGGAGLLFEPGCAEELAHQVTALFNNSHYYQKVAKRCKDRAVEYDINKTAANYCQLYSALINE